VGAPHASEATGALACGALRLIETVQQTIEEGGIDFIIRCERFGGVAINALGFAGSVFVRDDAQLETIKRVGPMAALRAVSGGVV
jgi:ATP adenylyltransferase/5',5'''-P-1,P-4-tetraphosphate phosphorylase II